MRVPKPPGRRCLHLRTPFPLSEETEAPKQEVTELRAFSPTIKSGRGTLGTTAYDGSSVEVLVGRTTSLLPPFAPTFLLRSGRDTRRTRVVRSTVGTLHSPLIPPSLLFERAQCVGFVSRSQTAGLSRTHVTYDTCMKSFLRPTTVEGSLGHCKRRRSFLSCNLVRGGTSVPGSHRD